MKRTIVWAVDHDETPHVINITSETDDTLIGKIDGVKYIIDKRTIRSDEKPPAVQKRRKEVQLGF